MNKLRLASIDDDRPVKLSIELPAQVFRDLKRYSEAIASEGKQSVPEPSKLIAPMLERFMASDRQFRRVRKATGNQVSTLSDQDAGDKSG